MSSSSKNFDQIIESEESFSPAASASTAAPAILETTATFGHNTDSHRNANDESALITSVHSDKSSSTEGPDSSNHSTSSSPLHVMIPAYPYGDERDDGGENGAAGSLAPLLPQFYVKFTNEISKNGDIVTYRIKVKKLGGAGGANGSTNHQSDGSSSIIEREYDDFEFLHHTLTTQNRLDGLIVPPLPARKSLDPASVEAESRRLLGDSDRHLKPDDFEREARALDKYLQRMLTHPVFGRDPNLFNFLDLKEAPTRTKIKRGFLAGVRESFDARKTNGVKDPDDFFQKEREWAVAYGAQLKDAKDKFRSMINSQLRLSNQVTHLATMLNASVGGTEGPNAFYNRINARFSTCLEEERKGIEREIRNEEDTLENYLVLWTGYLESENSMLQRRTSVVVDLDKANKTLAKSKPNKFAVSKLLRDEKEQELESCSKVGNLEVRRFHQQRLFEMKETLVQYTEGQIQAAKTTQHQLSQCIFKLRDFPLPVAATNLADPE